VVDADGSTSTTWRWELNTSTAELPVWTPIAGADSANFSIPGDESFVGKSVRVVATTTDALGGTTEFVTAAQPIAGVNDAPEGTVTISGSAVQGETLNVTNTLSDAEGMGPVSYQWKADGVAIDGATDASFTLTQAQLGKVITVTASYIDQGGTSESVTSAATAAVVDPNRPPTAVEDFAGVAKNAPTSIAVLANDSDEDGDALTVLSVTQPSTGGTVSIQNNAVLFTPNSATWTGTTTFSYTVKDTGNLQAVATVTVVVGTAFNGTDTANTLSGTKGIDVIRGNGGNDSINANAAGDVVYGGLGNDTITGGAGADTLFGEAGNDTFRVGSSELTGDVISGGDDVDTLAFTSNVTLTGGFTVTGVETLNMGARTLTVQTTVHIDLSAMNLVSRGAINGDSQANRITGTRDADSINGSTGNDNLAGTGGNDTVYGGTGADSIRGGLGNDTLYGGSSSKADTAIDTFVFDTAPDSATNWDTIIGFEATARDKIALDVQNIFTAIRLNGTTGLDADEFRSNATGNAEDANDYLVFDTTTGNLWYDPDGNGATAKKLIAKITLANGTLDPSDFTTTPPPGP
jgi:Ca2+-binding RTX toxin-like protein